MIFFFFFFFFCGFRTSRAPLREVQLITEGVDVIEDSATKGLLQLKISLKVGRVLYIQLVRLTLNVLNLLLMLV